METIKWVLCPICGNKTRTIMQEDTELKNFPLYCPKCKQQTLVGASQSLCKPPN
ncbi:conjugal transfer protein [[Eubacterium] rectale]|uniref:Conjugal transfer protein n=2 Tax=Clostridia TaxID=186801 RepID=A0A414HQA4_9FIRM|nr:MULTISPECIES: cysteine-rich KTR domain-containing protein [Clostridia]MCB5914780.1 cysteine-rich KTR domain-containing protein [Lachnospiraceae bacterium 210521-DFI.5.19]MDD6965555.1 cysteine-rich KTR domain-containing protein [Bacillota bacterium]MBC5666672.1 cysteine-rich KTR domain-containing protein [Eubacterium segne]MBT9700971.1 conjugal transfer protein [Agathobacter rectalis]MCG4698817.1 cysteine-rich KTR domain-containing protein [Anaerobutyricum soehngenii]